MSKPTKGPKAIASEIPVFCEHTKLVSIDDLKPNPRNPNQHPDKQIALLAKNIRQLGWRHPITVSTRSGFIVSGHGRLQAAQLLQVKEVPVDFQEFTGDAEEYAVLIADNRLAEIAEINTDTLKALLSDLDAEMGLEDMTLTGFTPEELEEMLTAAPPDGLTDPDQVPETPVEPVSVLGDVWVMGKHRIVCGDCTMIDTVKKVLNGVEPDLMVTDPPYGVEYDPEWRKKAGINKNTEKMGKVLNEDKADWRDAWALFPGNIAYVWHAGKFAREVQNSLEACEFEIRSQIIWAKDRFALSRGHYHWQHEPCWYAVRKGATGKWCGDRSQSTLWSIKSRDDNGTGHGTQKPVECMKRPILNNSSPGQAVYEPFSGSGTTILACEMTGRSCLAVELNPAYVDVAVKRWEEYTGKKAIHEATGQTFEQVKKQAKK